jgi:hypothetical protein
MTCHPDELTPRSDEPFNDNAYPRVNRDGLNVCEIAENLPDFIGHARPRLFHGRNEMMPERNERHGRDR